MEPTRNVASDAQILVTGLFEDRARAENAYEAIASRGYRPDDISLLMSDETRKRHFDADEAAVPTATIERGNKAAKGAGVGGAVGGTIGAIAAAITAVGTSLVVPGLGLVVAGPLAAVLAGLGAGGAAGGLVGALIGAGIPEERVKRYEEGIRRGGILIAVRARSEEDAEYLEREFIKAGGEIVYR